MPQCPLALFVYNRPRHTRMTVEALLRNEGAPETDLYVFSDGPKTPAVAGRVDEVREYTRSIRGFRSLNLVERPGNLGLQASIVDGVTRLTEEHGCAIVVEDDLVTSRSFLEFMNLGLQRYRKEDQVMQVAGCLLPSSFAVPENSFFLPFVTSWGWATWQRAWRQYEPEAAGFERLSNSPALKQSFDLNGYFKFFELLENQRRSKSVSWAVLWYLTVFMRRGLTLYPQKSLVRNMGLDGSGVHSFTRTLSQGALDEDFRVTVLPEAIEASPFAEAFIRGLVRPKLSLGSIVNRLKTRFLE